MIGVFLDNTQPVAPYQWGTEGGPLAWIYSGEGGSTADLAVFKEGGPAATGYMPLADYDAVPANSIPGFETGVIGSRGPATSSGVGINGSWVQVRIESSGSTINWYLNGALVDSYDNSGGFYSAGNIFLGTTDPFNSVNRAGGTIIDNVVVEDMVVPEPGTLTLLTIGVLGLGCRARRHAGRVRECFGSRPPA